MTLGYRHLMGIGVPRSCEDAVFYYKRVADKGSLLYQKFFHLTSNKYFKHRFSFSN
jgi:TPR repeat protein